MGRPVAVLRLPGFYPGCNEKPKGYVHDPIYVLKRTRELLGGKWRGARV